MEPGLLTRSRSSSINSHSSRTSVVSTLSYSDRQYQSLVSTQDVIQGIHAANGAESTSSSSAPASPTIPSLGARSISWSSEKKTSSSTTALSRWTKVKSMIGMRKSSNSQLSAACVRADDFDSILSDWTSFCQQEGCPLTKLNTVTKEFEKRKASANTADAKSKLDLQSCDLTDLQVKQLVKALVKTPKVAVVDLRHNPHVTHEGKRAMDYLSRCQVDASRTLTAQQCNDQLMNVLFLQEIKWDPPKAAATTNAATASAMNPAGIATSDSAQSPPDAETLAAEDSILRDFKVELEHTNAKSKLYAVFQRDTDNASRAMTLADLQRNWKAIVGSSASKLESYKTSHPLEDVPGRYSAFEECFIWGLIEAKKLAALPTSIALVTASQDHDDDSFVLVGDTMSAASSSPMESSTPWKSDLASSKDSPVKSVSAEFNSLSPEKPPLSPARSVDGHSAAAPTLQSPSDSEVQHTSDTAEASAAEIWAEIEQDIVRTSPLTMGNEQSNSAIVTSSEILEDHSVAGSSSVAAESVALPPVTVPEGAVEVNIESVPTVNESNDSDSKPANTARNRLRERLRKQRLNSESSNNLLLVDGSGENTPEPASASTSPLPTVEENFVRVTEATDNPVPVTHPEPVSEQPPERESPQNNVSVPQDHLPAEVTSPTVLEATEEHSSHDSTMAVGMNDRPENLYVFEAPSHPHRGQDSVGEPQNMVDQPLVEEPSWDSDSSLVSDTYTSRLDRAGSWTLTVSHSSDSNSPHQTLREKSLATNTSTSLIRQVFAKSALDYSSESLLEGERLTESPVESVREQDMERVSSMSLAATTAHELSTIEESPHLNDSEAKQSKAEQDIHKEAEPQLHCSVLDDLHEHDSESDLDDDVSPYPVLSTSVAAVVAAHHEETPLPAISLSLADDDSTAPEMSSVTKREAEEDQKFNRLASDLLSRMKSVNSMGHDDFDELLSGARGAKMTDGDSEPNNTVASTSSSSTSSTSTEKSDDIGGSESDLNTAKDVMIVTETSSTAKNESNHDNMVDSPSRTTLPLALEAIEDNSNTTVPAEEISTPSHRVKDFVKQFDQRTPRKPSNEDGFSSDSHGTESTFIKGTTPNPMLRSKSLPSSQGQALSTSAKSSTLPSRSEGTEPLQSPVAQRASEGDSSMDPRSPTQAAIAPMAASSSQVTPPANKGSPRIVSKFSNSAINLHSTGPTSPKGKSPSRDVNHSAPRVSSMASSSMSPKPSPSSRMKLGAPSMSWSGPISSLSSPPGRNGPAGSSPRNQQGGASSTLSPTRDGKDRGKERELLSTHHPAFRRHDGRHKMVVATQQQQTTELKRMRSNSLRGDHLANLSASLLTADFSSERFETADNPLFTGTSSTSQKSSPRRSLSSTRTERASTVLLHTTATGNGGLVTEDKSSVTSSPARSTTPSNRSVSRGSRTMSPQQRRYQHVLSHNLDSNAFAGNGTPGKSQALTTATPRKYSFVHANATYVNHHDFPRYVDLSRQHKTTQTLRFGEVLRADQFPEVLTLSLHTNSLTLIDRLVLKQRFVNLVELDLSNNAIATTISSKSFPSTLTRLDLSFNEIKSIRDLIELNNLTDLNVSHNKLKKVDPLPQSLVNLDISFNYIEDIAEFDTLKANQALQWLNIDSDEIPQAYLRLAARELKRSLPDLDVRCLQDILNNVSDMVMPILPDEKEASTNGVSGSNGTATATAAAGAAVSSSSTGTAAGGPSSSTVRSRSRMSLTRSQSVVANTSVVSLNSSTASANDSGRRLSSGSSASNSRPASRSVTPTNRASSVPNVDKTVFGRLHATEISGHKDSLTSPDRISQLQRERRLRSYKNKSAHYLELHSATTTTTNTSTSSPARQTVAKRSTAAFQANVDAREKRQQERQQEMDRSKAERIRLSRPTTPTYTRVDPGLQENNSHFLHATKSSSVRETMQREHIETETIRKRREQQLQSSTHHLSEELMTSTHSQGGGVIRGHDRTMSGNVSVSSMSFTSTIASQTHSVTRQNHIPSPLSVLSNQSSFAPLSAHAKNGHSAHRLSDRLIASDSVVPGTAASSSTSALRQSAGRVPMGSVMGTPAKSKSSAAGGSTTTKSPHQTPVGSGIGALNATPKTLRGRRSAPVLSVDTDPDANVATIGEASTSIDMGYPADTAALYDHSSNIDEEVNPMSIKRKDSTEGMDSSHTNNNNNSNNNAFISESTGSGKRLTPSSSLFGEKGQRVVTLEELLGSMPS